ncbi:MAG: TAXI family TRAP transporter solute-binding subunit, partial [Planctomycetaceae bacterium]
MSGQRKISRDKIAKDPSREHLVMVITAVLVGIAVIAVVNHFIQPAPPRHITISTGMERGSYVTYAEWYRQILGREKVNLELLPSSGAVENLKRLQDPASRVDVGFVQGGTGSRSEAPNLLSLGALFYTPLWVFYRGPGTYDDLSQFKGKKINIGPEGSGSRKFSIDLLEASKAAERRPVLLGLPNPDAAKELLEGKIDAVMIFGTPDNPTVQELLKKGGIKLLSFSQAEAYTRLFPALSHVILPAGLLDLTKRRPPV